VMVCWDGQSVVRARRRCGGFGERLARVEGAMYCCRGFEDASFAIALKISIDVIVLSETSGESFHAVIEANVGVYMRAWNYLHTSRALKYRWRRKTWSSLLMLQSGKSQTPTIRSSLNITPHKAKAENSGRGGRLWLDWAAPWPAIFRHVLILRSLPNKRLQRPNAMDANTNILLNKCCDFVMNWYVEAQEVRNERVAKVYVSE